MGDFTNLVIVLAGDLLGHAESLLRMGLHTTDVVKGYKKALKKFEEIIEGLYKQENFFFRINEHISLLLIYNRFGCG